MIADMMGIVPIRVWLFWLFALQFLIIIIGYKAYRTLRKDNVRIMQIMMGKQ